MHWPTQPGTRARRIFVRRFERLCSIGVHPQERAQPQRVRFDVDLYLYPEAEGSERRDDIASVLDYDFVRQEIVRLTTGRHFDLQETLCSELLEACLAREQVRGARVSTEKPDVYPDCEAVGVELIAFKS